MDVNAMSPAAQGAQDAVDEMEYDFTPRFVKKQQRLEGLDAAIERMLDACTIVEPMTIVIHDCEADPVPIVRRCAVCGGHDGPTTSHFRRGHPYHGKPLSELAQREIEHRDGCDVARALGNARHVRRAKPPTATQVSKVKSLLADLTAWASKKRGASR